MAAYLKIQLVHSAICREQDQKDTLRGLGLGKMNQVRILKNTPAILGMVHKVRHLVKFEETSSAQPNKKTVVSTYKLGAKAGAKPKAAKKAKPTQATKSKKAE